MRKKIRKSRFGTVKKPFASKHFIFVLVSIAGVFLLVLLFIVGRYFLIKGLKTTDHIVDPVILTSESKTIDEALQKYGIEHTPISYIDGGDVVSFKIKSGTTVYFSTTKSIPEQIDLLLLILRKTSIENKKATVIDLHYAKPIVKF